MSASRTTAFCPKGLFSVIPEPNIIFSTPSTFTAYHYYYAVCA